MNRPFSFRSELKESLGAGPELVNALSLPVKIHWHRPVQFPVEATRRTDRESVAFTDGALRFHLLRGDLNRPARKPTVASRLPNILRTCGLALALLPVAASAQSLWRDEASKPMYADKRAASVGDILTILVQESTSSSKDNKTETAKKSGLDASLETFFYSPAASGFLTKGGQMPAVKFNSKSDFAGGGAINNSEKLSARAAVTVMDVLPNRNLVVEGRRETQVSGEKQTMVLRGVVRPEDVLGNNTIYSYNVADATIQIISKGTITDSQRKGWFHKIWDKVAPF
jgi:flagellar L-ring protein FlgH